MQEIFFCILQLVIYHFLRVYYGISVYIERVSLSQLKLEILGGRDRTFVNIYLNRGILHTSFVPLLLDVLSH